MPRRAGKQLTAKRRWRKYGIRHDPRVPAHRASTPAARVVPPQSIPVPTMPLITGWASPSSSGDQGATAPTPSSSQPRKQPPTATRKRSQKEERTARPLPPLIPLPRKEADDEGLKLRPVTIPPVDWQWYQSLPPSDPRHAAWKVLQLFGSGAADPPTTGRKCDHPGRPAGRPPPPPAKRPRYDPTVVPTRPAIKGVPSNLQQRWMQPKTRFNPEESNSETSSE